MHAALEQINERTTRLAAELKSGRPLAWHHFILPPMAAFGRTWIGRGTIQEGTDGFVKAWLAAIETMLLEMKIWHLQHPAPLPAPGAAMPRQQGIGPRTAGTGQSAGSEPAREPGHATTAQPVRKPGEASSGEPRRAEAKPAVEETAAASLSVIIITLNEERHIAACLESVAWAGEIVVVDSQSQDATAAIARQYTDRLFIEKFRGYSGQKNFALDQAHGEWILWLDADERVTPALAAEIRRTIAANPAEAGFEMPRRAFFLGRWIRHCGWYPGHVLRLFRRDSGRFDDRQVHETLLLQGRRGRLSADLDHYTDDSLEHYFWKFNRYTSLAAGEVAARKKKIGVGTILLRPLHALIKMYLLKQGFRDGVPGLMLCLLSAAYVAAKYAKAREAARVADAK